MMPRWTFTESFEGEDGAREEYSCVSRNVEDGDWWDMLWFFTRCMEVSSGMPVKQMTVALEDGTTYSTEL